MAGIIEGAKTMTSIQYVSRKDGTYYFRRTVRLGDDKPFRLRLSLRTMNHRQAKAIAPALAMACEVVRRRLMTTMGRDGLSAAQRAEIFKRQMLRERDRIEAGHAELQLMDLGDQLPIEALNFRLDAGEAVSRELANNGDTADFLFVRIPDESAPDDEDHPIEIMTWEDFAGSLAADNPHDAVTVHLDALGIEATALNRQMALRVVHQAAVEALREYKRNLENPGAAFMPVPVFGADVPTSSPPAYATSSTSYERTESPGALPSRWAMMTASQAAAAFIDANPRTGGHDGKSRKKGSSWTEKTREQFKLPALLLEQVMAGKPLSTVTDFDLVELDRCFNSLHGPSFRKSPRHRQMTIQEIVEENAAAVREGEIAEDEIGLGIGTTNRHWGFLRQLTNWFQRHHPIADLDYTAFIIDDDRDQRLLRDTYSVDEGQVLFSLPPWTGCASERRRFAPGETIIHDSCYFVPMIAWYTGLRREEVCGLQLIDIDQEDGLWYFKVQDNDVRTLKTKTSRRLVPFASELVRLRLPEYVAALRIAGETLLFPELAAESGKGTRGDAYYKIHWKKTAARLDFLERGQAMHSFRHTVTDELKNLSVFEEVRADLVGHKIQSETGGRYSKAARLAPLRAAVDQIPKVTSALTAPSLALLPAGMRKPRRARPQRRT